MLDTGIMNMGELVDAIEKCQKEIESRKKTIVNGYNTLQILVSKEFKAKGMIPAIKLFRELTNEGLKVSKDVVESWVKTYYWTTD